MCDAAIAVQLFNLEYSGTAAIAVQLYRYGHTAADTPGAGEETMAEMGRVWATWPGSQVLQCCLCVEY